ncbi:MAG: argininosuccinate lyase, partial [Lachnospiraceae bacterium]|nr:argininosuccinate lyase [Lachnospiraceae bacterium]
KTGRVYGDLFSLMTTMKGLPLAYNKDMQEDKEPAFDAIDTAHACVKLFAGMLSSLSFRKDVMEKSAARGFTNATDAADYLVVKGVPFRDAHGIIGRVVLYCIEQGRAIEELSLDELRSFSEAFGEDIYEAVSLKTCVDKRLTLGGPAPQVMKAVIENRKEWLATV